MGQFHSAFCAASAPPVLSTRFSFTFNGPLSQNDKIFCLFHASLSGISSRSKFHSMRARINRISTYARLVNCVSKRLLGKIQIASWERGDLLLFPQAVTRTELERLQDLSHVIAEAWVVEPSLGDEVVRGGEIAS